MQQPLGVEMHAYPMQRSQQDMACDIAWFTVQASCQVQLDTI